MALRDNGSSQIWVDKELLQKLNLNGEEVTFHVAGIRDTSPIPRKKVKLSWVNSHKILAVGKENDLRQLKRKYGYLSCIRQNTIRLSEVKVKLRQDAFPLICPAASKNKGAKTPWAVKLPLAWSLSGPLPASEKSQCYSVCSMSQDEELTAVVKQ